MSKTDNRSTPDSLFVPLNEEFHFTLDPCANKENAKCERYYTYEQNGLIQSWRGEIVFMNPPYSNLYAWMLKARYESPMATVVCILPCDTSTNWFHDFLWFGNGHESQEGVQLRFPKGRYKFGKYSTNPKFATIIAVMRNE